MAHRKGGDDDDVPHKPFAAPYQPPPRPAPAVDVSDAAAPSAADEAATRKQSADFLRDAESVLDSIRQALRARGAVGIRGLARNFKIVDTDRSGRLDHDEVQKLLRLCKITLPQDAFDTLFTHADSDGSGHVDYEEFLRLVRGRLAPLRRKLVVAVFNAIDQRARADSAGFKDGRLTSADLAELYSAKEHPEVKAGRKTESAVLQEMLANFEGKRGDRDGAVSLQEWVAYYEEISASMDNDDHFNATVVSAWPMLFDERQMGDAVLRPPCAASAVDAIEKKLIDAIRTRSSGSSETRALETTFKQFDVDKNGTIEFAEFRAAMERFGLATGGATAVSGCTLEVIEALFERYDPDGSGTLSYDEFIKGVFHLPGAPTSARAAGKDLTTATGTSLPLPSERGDGTRPPTAGATYARGRGGVMGGGMNAGVAPTAGSGATRSAGAPSTVAGASFNRSSGIFR